MSMTGTRDPEIYLWRTVVAQAFHDARMKYRGSGSGGDTPSDRVLARREARDWLLYDADDFRCVCHLALLDPDAVRDKALKLAARGWGRWKGNRYRKYSKEAA